jgi:hypothetical protein
LPDGFATRLPGGENVKNSVFEMVSGRHCGLGLPTSTCGSDAGVIGNDAGVTGSDADGTGVMVMLLAAVPALLGVQIRMRAPEASSTTTGPDWMSATAA